MAIQAIVDDGEPMDFLGEIPALFIIAAVLGILMPRGGEAV